MRVFRKQLPISLQDRQTPTTVDGAEVVAGLRNIIVKRNFKQLVFVCITGYKDMDFKVDTATLMPRCNEPCLRDKRKDLYIERLLRAVNLINTELHCETLRVVDEGYFYALQVSFKEAYMVRSILECLDKYIQGWLCLYDD